MHEVARVAHLRRIHGPKLVAWWYFSLNKDASFVIPRDSSFSHVDSLYLSVFVIWGHCCVMQRLLIVFITITGLFIVVVGSFVWTTIQRSFGVTTFASSPKLIPDWLAVTAAGELQLHRDGAVITLRRDALPEGYGLPVISPDGQFVAYARATDTTIALSVVTIASGDLVDLYAVPGSVPLAFVWSPNSAYIAFVADGGNVAYVTRRDGTLPMVQVARGAPAYMNWRNDSQVLLLHTGGIGRVGGTIATYDVASDTITVIRNDPANFQAPQWNNQGDGYYYVSDPEPLANPNDVPRAVITQQFFDGRSQIIADEGQATVRLMHAPQGDALAYIAATVERRVMRIWRNRQLMTLADTEPLAAFWSPDAQQIAVLVGRDDGKAEWHIIDVVNGQRRVLAAFEPSDMYIGYIRYFDAYTLSPWSDDGQWLLVSTSTVVQGQPTSGRAVVPLGRGVFAVWMP
jgi:hypothetical protein